MQGLASEGWLESSASALRALPLVAGASGIVGVLLNRLLSGVCLQHMLTSCCSMQLQDVAACGKQSVAGHNCRSMHSFAACSYLQHAVAFTMHSIASCSQLQHALVRSMHSIAACSQSQRALGCSQITLVCYANTSSMTTAGRSCGGCKLFPITYRCAGHTAVGSAALDRSSVASLAAKSQASCKTLPVPIATSRHAQNYLKAVHRFCTHLASQKCISMMMAMMMKAWIFAKAELFVL